MKRCVFCDMDVAVEGFNFCSLECARWWQLSERLKKIEGLMVEIKYEIRKSNQVGGWEEGRN